MTPAIPQVEEKAFLRQEEKDKYLSVILERKSFLVVADAGSGKTTMAIALRDELKVRGYAVAIADYSDSAKLTLISIADQFAIATFYMVDTAKGGEKKVQLTVPELKEAIAKYLTNTENSVLICDNAHHYPVTLRYWLEEVVKKGSVLMFATHPPRKEVFLLIPRIETGLFHSGVKPSRILGF
jgi:GTPase SAR1 family protein